MRLISGRLREYDATRPATIPAPNSTPNMTMSPRTRRTRGAPDGPGAGLRVLPRARGRAALRATGRSRKHAVDEPARVFGRELFRKFDRFVDHDRSRRLRAVLHLEHAHAQHDAVDGRKTFDGPA